MTTPVFNPEYTLTTRIINTLKAMAAEGEFTASAQESVWPVSPQQVFLFKTLEGSEQNQQNRIINLPLPAVLVTQMPAKGSAMEGVNCADDEAIPFVIQIADSIAHPSSSLTPTRTYTDWMNRIRHKFVSDLTIFRQDFDPAVADPWLVKARDRVPSDPQKLWSHDQQVAAFMLVVYVRHHYESGAT